MRERRQVSYDDFIAVAENLVDSGLTTPDMLGVFGTPNGGLRSAMVSVQRPNLFGAAVSDAPLADMLRYHPIAITGSRSGAARPISAMRQYRWTTGPSWLPRPGNRYPLKQTQSSSCLVIQTGQRRINSIFTGKKTRDPCI